MRIPRVFWRITLLLLVSTFLLPSFAYAANFVATPAVIDGKGKTREILRYTITVENRAKHMLELYPWVADLDAASGVTGASDLGGGGPLDSRDTSLSRWIEITRAMIPLLPGEKKDIPVLIQIGINAKPGVYHALIHISNGGNRVTAEANKAETTDVAVNIEVLDDAHERLELNTFAPEKNFFGGNDARFNFGVANIGNRGVVPMGKIHIYDRRGQEVAAIEANKDRRRLEPNEKELLASVWASDGHFGRYKAMLELEYGTRGVVQDTVYFWIMPWTKLLAMFGTISLVGIILAIVIHSWGMAGRSGAKRRFAFAQLMPESHVRRGEFGEEYEAEPGTYVDGLTEVAIPPPKRTRYRAEEPRVPARAAQVLERAHHASEGHVGHHAHTEGGKVHLTKKEKPIDPNHIVTLGKRR